MGLGAIQPVLVAAQGHIRWSFLCNECSNLDLASAKCMRTLLQACMPRVADAHSEGQPAPYTAPASPFDSPNHLLHGLLHVNGCGHLLRINGLEGGSQTLTGVAVRGNIQIKCVLIGFLNRLCPGGLAIISAFWSCFLAVCIWLALCTVATSAQMWLPSLQ